MVLDIYLTRSKTPRRTAWRTSRSLSRRTDPMPTHTACCLQCSVRLIYQKKEKTSTYEIKIELICEFHQNRRRGFCTIGPPMLYMWQYLLKIHIVQKRVDRFSLKLVCSLHTNFKENLWSRFCTMWIYTAVQKRT